MPQWQSNDRTNSGRQMPTLWEWCARCRKYRPISEFVRETWERSPVKGKLVCRVPAKAGGCFEGPEPKAPPRTPDDNYYRTPNV